MPTLKTYRLFISHAWKYNDEYYRLERMLKSAKNFNFANYSVPEHDPLGTKTDKELMAALNRQIRPTQCVLILAGMYVNHRKWIQAEIAIAKGYGKPIVGIKPWGSQVTPVVVTKAAKEMVGWNTNSIVRAIREHSL